MSSEKKQPVATVSDQRNTALDGRHHSADLVELRISKLAMQYNLGSHACAHSDFECQGRTLY